MPMANKMRSVMYTSVAYEMFIDSQSLNIWNILQHNGIDQHIFCNAQSSQSHICMYLSMETKGTSLYIFRSN